MKFQLHELAMAANGKLCELWPDGSLLRDSQLTAKRGFSFSIDSRTLQPGQVFIALRGERADGHDYLGQALRNGACGLIVSDKNRVAQIEQQVSPSETTGISPYSRPFVILVDDTLKALQSIARVCRQKHTIPFIAVSGSNGKTTVKDMAASILSTRYSAQVLKSEKSFNNHLGVPLTLVNMSEQHAVAVVEIGMNAPGEIRHLAGIVRPEIGIVTNIALAHIGFFDSIEAIMQAKMELIEALPTDGCAVLNRDDALFARMVSYLRQGMGLIQFGIGRQPDDMSNPLVTAEQIIAAPDGTHTFDMLTPAGRFPVSLPIPGYHNISNALAAASCVFALTEAFSQMSLDEIKYGLEHFEPSPMRMHKFTHRQITFINDAYNANPASMKSALETLRNMTCQGKKIAVLGDMLELGPRSQSEHSHLGALAAQIPVDRLFLLGAYANDVARGAQMAGMKSHHIVIGVSHDQLAQEIIRQLEEGDLVLCKASRGMKMEIVLENMLKLLSV